MKGLHNVFKKVSNAGNVFKKVSDVGEDVFKKASGAVNAIKEHGPAIAEQISKGAGQAQNVLNTVSKISGKIAASPMTQMLPGGALIAQGAGMVSGISKAGAQGAGQLSSATNLKNYKKGGVNKQLENLADINRRGKELADTAKQAGSVFA